MEDSGNKIQIDSLWEYADPAASEARFRQALENTDGDTRLELLTQIARTYSLRSQFDQAHQILDELEPQLAGVGPLPRVRAHLERGRTYNSAGEAEKARSFFEQAWELARDHHIEGLAVDAAHMMAITHSGSPEAVDWNRRGLEIARGSKDPKASSLVPAMLNNSAWDLHDMGRFEDALSLFEEAEAEWTKRGRPQQIRIARYSVGRCLRSMGQYEKALKIQQDVEAELTQDQSPDGYVFEEIAENLAMLGKVDDSRPYFQKAYEQLSKDDWLVENEPKRLANLKARAEYN